jgi:hypothetical protein
MALSLTSCSGGGQTPQGGDQTQTGSQTTPPPATTPPATPPAPTPPDPKVVAQDYFKQNVFERFFKSDRCLNCHGFDKRREAGGPLAFHTTSTSCTSCHDISGVPNWRKAPDAPENRWFETSNADDIRQQIIDRKGAGLHDHLCVNDPFVQWCFLDSPLKTPPPPPGGTVNVGKVPGGGPHNVVGAMPPYGQISTLFPSEHDLMSFPPFKTAVETWMCLEKNAGTTDLGLPAATDCTALLAALP